MYLCNWYLGQQRTPLLGWLWSKRSWVTAGWTTKCSGLEPRASSWISRDNSSTGSLDDTLQLTSWPCPENKNIISLCWIFYQPSDQIIKSPERKQWIIQFPDWIERRVKYCSRVKIWVSWANIISNHPHLYSKQPDDLLLKIPDSDLSTLRCPYYSYQSKLN